MSAGTISLILNIALLVFLLFGFLAGLVRGAKKSGVRTIWLVGFLVLVFLLSPVISQSLMGLYIAPLGDTIGGFIEEQILAVPEIADLYASNAAMQELVLKLPPMVLNLVVVILLVLVAWLLSSICYLITKAVMNRKAKKKQNENKVYTVMNGHPVVIEKNEKPKKYRLWGGLIGAVGGFVMCFCLFLPITGTVRTVMQYIDVPPAQTASAEEEQSSFEYAMVSEELTNLLGEETIGYLNAINNSILVKVASVGNLDLAIYDGISTVNVGGQKVCLRNEVNAVATTYETVLYVQSLQTEDGNIDFTNLDFAKLEKTVNAIFDSGLVKTLGISTAESLIDDAVNGDLLANLVDEGKIDEDIAGYAKEILTEIEVMISANDGLSSTLKHDLLAILDVAKAVSKSGLLQVASGIEEVDKQTILDVCACLTGMHELSEEPEHDYLHDITTGLFSSDILKASLVGVANIGIEELKGVIENVLENDGKDITGDNAVVLGKVVQAGLDWTTVASLFETIFDSVTESQNLVAEVATNKNLDFNKIIRLEGFGTGITSAGKILNSLKSLPLLLNTENNQSIFENALKHFNRVDYVNKYVNLEGLKNINFEKELTPIAEIYAFAQPAIVAENQKTFAYKNLDFETLNTNQTLARLFDGDILKNVKTEEFKTELLDKNLGEDIEKYLTILLEDTEDVADLKNTVLALFGGVENAVKAGLVELLLDEEKTAVDVNLLVANLLVVEESAVNMRIQNVIENVFSDDKLCRIYADFINNFVADQDLEIGEFELPSNIEAFKTNAVTDLNFALPILMAVYLDLGITDFDTINLEEDGIMAILNVLLTDNFAGENGNAFKLGTSLDKLTNSDVVTTNQSKNILRELLYKNLDGVEFIDREVILSTTNQNFWKNELTALAPTLMLLHTTYSDSTEETTLLEVLINDGADALTETDGFKALSDEQIETTVYAICESQLLRPVAIDLLESLATTLGQMFDEGYECTLSNTVDLVSQKSQIANVILKALALTETDIEDYADLPTAVLESQEVQTALKNLLIALNSNASGVFGTVYSLVFDTVEKTISDANAEMINLVDGSYEEALELGYDAVIAQYESLLDVMKKAKALADLGLGAFDDILEDSTAKDALFTLLTALDANKTGAFGTAQEKIFEYFADVISTANSEIITLVDSAYEGEIQPTNAQILAQYNSILDILKKANAVKDLGASSVEALLDAEGGDVALKNLLNAMQESADGVFGDAYQAIFEYMETSYGELLETMANATSQTVVWNDVVAEYKELKSSL